MTMHPRNYRTTPAASERGLESDSAVAGRAMTVGFADSRADLAEDGSERAPRQPSVGALTFIWSGEVAR
jgi:hypothetical protein